LAFAANTDSWLVGINRQGKSIMGRKIFIVELDAQERARLCALISKGKASAKVILKARILLKADQAEGGPGWLDAQIVEALDTNLTVARAREAGHARS
jgi:hypothetical protein